MTASLRITRADGHITVESNRRAFGLSLEAAREFRDALTSILDEGAIEVKNEIYLLLEAASAPQRTNPEKQSLPDLADLLGI